MKINKLMLALAVAASAFISCNKQETTPVVENQLGNKSIVLNIANLLPTKSAGTSIANEAQVTLNNFQVFFSDGKALYQPKTATAEDFTAAQNYGTYFAETAETQKQFHFLDNNVNRVIVVGNLGRAINPQTEAELETEIKRLTLESQLDETNLTLYGWDNTLVESNLTFNPDEHQPATGNDQHPTPVMMAEVNLYPTVARFEVNNFTYAQVGEAVRDYTSMTIDNVSMINFYTEADITLPTGNENGGPNAIPTITPDQTKTDTYFGKTWNQDNIYQEYFTEMDKVTTKPWWFDVVGHELKTDAYVWDVNVTNGEGEDAVTNNCYAYHVFPGNVVPTFNVELTGVEQGITSLLYLQTKKLWDGETQLTAVEPGKIYKMDFVFDDSKLQDAEKCIDVKITVHDWVVVNITPEF